MRLGSIVAALVGFAAVAGCTSPPAELQGSSGSTGGTTAGGGSTSSTGTTGTTSGSSGTSTGSSTGTTGLAPGAFRGYVLFNDVDLSGFYTNHTVTAGFASEDAGINVDPLQDCSDGVAEPNGCCFRDNTNGDAGNASFDGGFNFDGGFSYDGGTAGYDGGTAGYDGGTAPNAGTLTLAASGSGFGTMSPGVGGLYAPFTGSWNAGDQLSVAATGADIGAFSGAVTAPTSASITNPAVGGFQPPSVSSSAALVVSWTGSGGKAAVILGSGLQGNSFSKSVTCYGDNHGQLTVSSTSMAHFAGAGYGALLVGLGNTVDLDAGNADVTVGADTLTGGFVQFQ